MKTGLDLGKIAIKFQGYKFSDDTLYDFRYSNNGLVAKIGDDTESYYYEPFITDSILIESEFEKKSGGISLNLINDGTLDELTEYNFEGRPLVIHISKDSAPNTYAFYLLHQAVIESLHCTEEKIIIKCVSPFEIFDQPINPATFSGDPGNYEGEVELKDKTKPRVFGDVFNISPLLLKSSTLVYGFNWSPSGGRDLVSSIDVVRDGGLALTLDTALGTLGDFATTSAMDVATPAVGKYITCVAQSTLKLQAPPIFPLTLDVSHPTNTYQEWLAFLKTELGLPGSDIHGSVPYGLGIYLTNSTSYTQADSLMRENLDIGLWFSANGFINGTLVRDDGVTTPRVNFVEAGIELTHYDDIVAFTIKRDKYELPYKKAKLFHKKNYTKQEQNSLSTSLLTEGQKLIYKLEYQSVLVENLCSPDPYLNDKEIENKSSILLLSDATTEVQAWIDNRQYTRDFITISCPILSYNSDTILGIVAEANLDFLNISDTLLPYGISTTTILISDANTEYNNKTMLKIGDIVTLKALRFTYENYRFIVYGSRINTRTLFVDYKLVGFRKESEC